MDARGAPSVNLLFGSAGLHMKIVDFVSITHQTTPLYTSKTKYYFFNLRKMHYFSSAKFFNFFENILLAANFRHHEFIAASDEILAVEGHLIALRIYILCCGGRLGHLL